SPCSAAATTSPSTKAPGNSPATRRTAAGPPRARRDSGDVALGLLDQVVGEARLVDRGEVGEAAEHHAAVDGEALAGRPGGLGAGEIADGGGDVIGAADAADGLVLHVAADDLLVADEAGGRVRLGEAGAHDVD